MNSQDYIARADAIITDLASAFAVPPVLLPLILNLSILEKRPPSASKAHGAWRICGYQLRSWQVSTARILGRILRVLRMTPQELGTVHSNLWKDTRHRILFTAQQAAASGEHDTFVDRMRDPRIDGLWGRCSAVVRVIAVRHIPDEDLPLLTGSDYAALLSHDDQPVKAAAFVLLGRQPGRTTCSPS